ncbi:MAG: flagellar motor protein MotA [Hyphomicrobiaceae bacterium]|nr:MAG: flagellar motor protein MotA [Hyphomicrobiaceae bacterium]
MMPRVSRPAVFLFRMFVFLMLAGFAIAILQKQAIEAFKHNPALNGVIIGVMLFGIGYFFRQVLLLFPEIKWVNKFRISDPGLVIDAQPKLLAPMATMLRDRRGSVQLSANAMRTLMDSIASRLDETREISRYLVGLLIFLGLLGTFWGLLGTISSIGEAIRKLDPNVSQGTQLFESLKTGLTRPLDEMGTAFSASLFGLAGSLVLGFLDLQAGQAQGRFYKELEEWLAHVTELTPREGQVPSIHHELLAAVHELHRAVRGIAVAAQAPPPTPSLPAENGKAIDNLSLGIEQLVKQMRAEQKVVREWIDDQAAQQSEITSLIRELSSTLGKRS